MTWNLAALGKYVWFVANRPEMMWVKWVHHVYLKHRDWWEYKPPKDVGWGWKQVCTVKEYMKTRFITQWRNSYSIKEGYKWLQGESRNV